MNQYLDSLNIVPGVMPADTAATAVMTQFVDLKTAHEISFMALFGTVTTASADQPITLTVEASTVDASTGAENVGFSYSLSSAVTANTWGDLTAADASTGYAPVATVISGMMVQINVDPAAVQAAKADARWVRLIITPDAGATACNVAAFAAVNPRYKQLDYVSTT